MKVRLWLYQASRFWPEYNALVLTCFCLKWLSSNLCLVMQRIKIWYSWYKKLKTKSNSGTFLPIQTLYTWRKRRKYKISLVLHSSSFRWICYGRLAIVQENGFQCFTCYFISYHVSLKEKLWVLLFYIFFLLGLTCSNKFLYLLLVRS